MKHPHDGWNPKRIDPEPEPKDELPALTVVLWAIVLWLAILNLANFLGTHVG